MFFFFQYRECNLEPYTCQASILPLNYVLRFFFLIFNLRKGFEKLKFLRLVMNSLCSTGGP